MLSINELKKLNNFISISQSVDDDSNYFFNTNTKTLSTREIFIALKGDRFNALSFLNGIDPSVNRFVIYEKNDENDKIVSSVNDHVFIAVKSSISALQEIASLCINKFRENDGKVFCIGGSNGKTTTKEMLYHILSQSGHETIRTLANNNNHIGVPLTIFQIRPTTKYAIIELGSNHPGEIDTLCSIVKPNMGYVTNIGDSHLEFFKDRDGVFEEEGQLFFWIKKYSGDKYFLKNKDDDHLKSLNNYDWVESVSHTQAVKINNTNIFGSHNHFNLEVALKIATHLTSEDSRLFSAARSFTATANRSQWVKFLNCEVFLDAYNANPSSMRPSIQSFYEEVDNSRSLYVIGDMNELGDSAAKFHYETGQFLNTLGVENVIFVGKFSSGYNNGFDSKGQTFLTAKELYKTFISLASTYDYIFIKGSRSLQLESLLDINNL